MLPAPMRLPPGVELPFAWLMVHGFVNAAPGFGETAGVVNGFSDPILDLYGPEAGVHARTAPGVATLPLDHAVFVAAEVGTRGQAAIPSDALPLGLYLTTLKALALLTLARWPGGWLGKLRTAEYLPMKGGS